MLIGYTIDIDYQIWFNQHTWRVQQGERYRLGTRNAYLLLHPNEHKLITLMNGLLEVIGTIQQAKRDSAEFSVELFTDDAGLADLIRSGGEPSYWRMLNLIRSTLSMFQQWKVYTKPLGKKLEE